MVEISVLRERILFLAEYINDLEQEQIITLHDFLSNKKIRRYVERTLHLAIECCLDIGSHIISAEKLREPSDNKDIFRVLSEDGYIPKQQLNNLMKMAQFRNLIVHSYTKIDPEIIYGILMKNVVDLKRFSGHILNYINQINNA